MIIKNEKGFGAREMLVVSTVCLVLAVIFLVIAIKSSYHEKFNVMEHNARMFGISAPYYKLENEEDNNIYMLELMDEGIFTKMKNPFGGDEYCDILESKIEVIKSKKYITLRCGNYLIDKEYIGNDRYKIYRITNWSKNKIKDNYQKLTAYNYKENGKAGLDGYYDEEMFLYVFNKKMNSDYGNITQIPEKYKVYSENLYRSKILIDKKANKKI